MLYCPVSYSEIADIAPRRVGHCSDHMKPAIAGRQHVQLHKQGTHSSVRSTRTLIVPSFLPNTYLSYVIRCHVSRPHQPLLPPRNFPQDPVPTPSMSATTGQASRTPEDALLDLEKNPDAIALRSTIAILEMQRQRAVADMRRLEKIKARALAEPDLFMQELSQGRLRHANGSDGLPGLPHGPVLPTGTKRGLSTRNPSASSRFPPIPTPQNIVRCPPINWAMYHVVGESLDRLHAEQQRQPGAGESGRLVDRVPETVVAAPYRLWTDLLKPQPVVPADPADGAGAGHVAID